MVDDMLGQLWVDPAHSRHELGGDLVVGERAQWVVPALKDCAGHQDVPGGTQPAHVTQSQGADRLSGASEQLKEGLRAVGAGVTVGTVRLEVAENDLGVTHGAQEIGEVARALGPDACGDVGGGGQDNRVGTVVPWPARALGPYEDLPALQVHFVHGHRVFDVDALGQCCGERSGAGCQVDGLLACEATGGQDRAGAQRHHEPRGDLGLLVTEHALGQCGKPHPRGPREIGDGAALPGCAGSDVADAELTHTGKGPQCREGQLRDTGGHAGELADPDRARE